ncbi:P1 family peptidase [Caldanaerobius polysaccharolyticus]|uniref:P1 family peptidase n=1 Tax=Caldanaerobius polysaccharolyticus TaxID=44256 RepID=UPI00047C3D03|nr:P1 family peptidase [Caldanaerobius polysaccharolyticus]
MFNAITDVEGIKVGHASDYKAMTGCTVVLCERGAVGGVDVRGSAPGTRETDLLRPANLVQHVHGVLLAGGSAFGLNAAAGVMRYLEEKGIGFDTAYAKVPIVPAAVIYDLGIGDPKRRPDEAMGYRACVDASEGDVPQGTVGAGTGATIGKILGMKCADKGGVGTASISLGGITVGAIVVVNALGDVYDEGTIIAGARGERGFINTAEYLLKFGAVWDLKDISGELKGCNTTIGVVATDGALTKEQANKLASISHDGLAMAIKPVHTMSDGDTMFALSTGTKAPVSDKMFMSICAAAVEAVRRSVINAVKFA